MARPVIALLTDFGTSDHYVGTMKGVAVGICDDAVIVDISHDIAPQDVAAAAMMLRASFRYFPTGTIFVVVVDPGVGSSRRAIAAEAGGFRFVGPDNGVFGAVWEECRPSLVVELTNPEFRLAAVSKTFEGRDRFAPAAAWLARGVSLQQFGPRLETWHPFAATRPTMAGNRIAGEILQVDRFGNLVTNIERAAVDALGDPASLTVTLGTLTIPLVQTYGDVGQGAVCALFGSSGQVEIAVNRGHAAAILGASRGAAVTVQRRDG